jgi:hypothetical protein
MTYDVDPNRLRPTLDRLTAVLWMAGFYRDYSAWLWFAVRLGDAKDRKS